MTGALLPLTPQSQLRLSTVIPLNNRQFGHCLLS